MPLSPRDNRRRLLAAVASCAALTCLVPGQAAHAPRASIEVTNKGPVRWNFNTGTQVLEQEVTIRQAPDTLIRADRAEGSNLADNSYDNGHWVLSGSVHIEFEGAMLDANSATVIFADGSIRSIQVQGRPASFSRPAGTAGQRNEGRANTITYDGTRRQVRFVGHTTYTFGPYEGTADKPLVYDIDSTEIASEKGGSDDSRIIFTFRNMQASAGSWRANIDKGTQLLEQDVELRQAPDTLIRAGRAEGSNLADGSDDGHWTLGRKVHIEHQDGFLDADSATVTFAAGDARAIQVHGNPARFSYPTTSEGKRFEGRADTVSFDGAKQQLRVLGHPSHYSFGVDDFIAEKPLLYAIESGVLSSEDNGDPDARVRGTIRPEKRVNTPRMPPRGTAQ